MDFIYWRHPTMPGIKVEEITGGERYSGKLWLEMARQVYCENGRETYREIGHFRNGAPFLFGETSRISVTHCRGLLAVATLPPTPEVDLSEFSERAALGIDAERADREQVIRIRERFLSAAELEMIPADDVTLNVTAWTIKEAVYKAAMREGLDFRRCIAIRRMPKHGPATTVFDPKEFGLTQSQKELPEDFFGEAVTVPDTTGSENTAEFEIDGKGAAGTLFKIYSYMTDGFVVTLAYSPRCAKFGKSDNAAKL